LRTRLRPPSHPIRNCAQRAAVGELDVDAGVVLREARHVAPAVGGDGQLADPGRQDALDVVLPERQHVVVPAGKVAEVERDRREAGVLTHLSFREEAFGDPTLIQHLDRARVQTAGARPGQLLGGAPLDDRDVHARQRQLARQHQPRWTSSSDHHGMVRHGHDPAPPAGACCKPHALA
jgi:hypothetical protein